MEGSRSKRLTWQQRLDAAAIRGKFEDEDIRLAADWGCCAVGEKFHVAENCPPQYNSGSQPSVPYWYYSAVKAVAIKTFDFTLSAAERLIDLGSDFYVFVRENRVEEAQHTFDAINRMYSAESSYVDAN